MPKKSTRLTAKMTDVESVDYSDEVMPVKGKKRTTTGRKKADLSVPRDAKAVAQVKDASQVKGVAQVATTEMADQSTSTRKSKKRASRARY